MDYTLNENWIKNGQYVRNENWIKDGLYPEGKLNQDLTIS